MIGTPDLAFWAGKRVLVTGHTGFKGAWLTRWLERIGAEVFGVSLTEPVSTPNLWDLLNARATDLRADIATTVWQGPVAEFDPQIVFHLAAQALVPRGYSDPVGTFSSNVMGTVRVMEALDRFPSLEAAVIVTTDKVYETSQTTPFRESDHLGGKDPYSASKAAAELVVHTWPTDRAVVTARAGNVIGGGDWAADRLVPDLVRAWGREESLTLRRPEAVRPWQHVLEPLRGYLLHAERAANSPDTPPALNFGPSVEQRADVAALVAHAAHTWGEQTSHRPTWATGTGPRIAETDLLELDSSAADEVLGWRNVLDWQQSVDWTLRWHAQLASGADAASLVDADLDDYLTRVEHA